MIIHFQCHGNKNDIPYAIIFRFNDCDRPYGTNGAGVSPFGLLDVGVQTIANDSHLAVVATNEVVPVVGATQLNPVCDCEWYSLLFFITWFTGAGPHG